MHEPVLAVVDCFAAVHAGEENSTQDTNAVLTPLATSGQRYGTAVVLIHHPTKSFDKSRASRLPAIRGNGTITRRAREVLWLGRSGNEWVLEQLAHNRRRGAPDGTTWHFRVEDPTGDTVVLAPRSEREPESPSSQPDAALDAAVFAEVTARAGQTTDEIRAAIRKNKDAVKKSLERQERGGWIRRQPRRTEKTTRVEWFAATAAGVGPTEIGGPNGVPSV